MLENAGIFEKFGKKEFILKTAVGFG